MARKTPAAERTRRLIALLGRLNRDTRIPLADLALEVGVSPEDLEEDLVALSMCGVYPYDPYELFPVMVEDGEVVVFGDMPSVRGPVRLAPAEAKALAAALQTAGLDASDPLTDRLLEASGTGFDAENLERSVVAAIAAHDRDVYQTLAGAQASRSVVAIEYFSAWRGTSSRRLVEAATLFSDRGAWYLVAWCRESDEWRTFRVDRIRSAHATEEHFDPRPSAPRPEGAFPAQGHPVARLRFAPGVAFDEREWPGGRVVDQLEDGSLVAEVPYSGTSRLARWVTARLGTVEVLSPAEARASMLDFARSQHRT